jgi:hypothetical protein
MDQVAYYSERKKAPSKNVIDEEDFKRRKEELKKMMGEA